MRLLGPRRATQDQTYEGVVTHAAREHRSVLTWLALAFMVTVPVWGDAPLLTSVAGLFIMCTSAVGLNLLVGYAGQASLGHGAFMAIGAYFAAVAAGPGHGSAVWILPGAFVASALVGILFGIPSLRIRGFYLSMATLGAQFIVQWLLLHVPPRFDLPTTMNVPRPAFFGWVMQGPVELYFLALAVCCASLGVTLVPLRGQVGRVLVAIRDREAAAEVLGINTYAYKLGAFGVSSGFAGLAGALYSYHYGVADFEQFTLSTSVQYLAMIIIGGLGNPMGPALGVVFVALLPKAVGGVLRMVVAWSPSTFPDGAAPQTISAWSGLLFGVLIIAFLVVEPGGLARLLSRTRRRLRAWPFA